MNKRSLKTMLLGVVLAGAMASCQKDEFSNEMVVPSHEMSQKNLAHVSHTLCYWIDGVGYSTSFTSEAEKSAYISYLINLTLEGKEITIGGSQNPRLAPEAPDKQTFKTADEVEMNKWALEMQDKGYEVSYKFDKETGLYTGTATKGGSRTMAVSLSESE